MELTHVPKEFSSRYINDGFSGGEKKRMEILQLALMKPALAVLDETDSGLDIDALNTVSHGVNTVAEETGMGALIITHYQRILHLVEPEFVHIMFEGGSSRRAARSSSSSSSSAATAGSATRSPRPYEPRPACGDRLPCPRAGGPDVPRLGRDGADRAAGDRGRWTSTTTSTAPRSTAASTRSPPARPTPTRARATAWPRSPARRPRGTVFTRNATEAINLVAYSWGRANVGAGDLVVVTEMEHHSNLVPWQLLCAQTGAELAYVPLDDDWLLDLSALGRAARRGRSSSPSHSSNVLGTINPISEIAEPRTPPARSWWSTARRPRRTCRSTWVRWAPTSTPGPATRPTGRPASGS